MAANTESKDSKTKQGCIGCSVVIAIGATIGLIIGIADACTGGGLSDPAYYQENQNSFEELLEETEFSDEEVSEQNILINRCLAGEVYRGAMSQQESADLILIINDKSDAMLWKTRRLSLAVQCIELGYTTDP